MENPHHFTGHCSRSSSSTLLIEASASFETLKKIWKSNTVAPNYLEESITSKNRIFIENATKLSAEESLGNKLIRQAFCQY